jgi:hypothetical protein
MLAVDPSRVIAGVGAEQMAGSVACQASKRVGVD